MEHSKLVSNYDQLLF